MGISNARESIETVRGLKDRINRNIVAGEPQLDLSRLNITIPSRVNHGRSLNTTVPAPAYSTSDASPNSPRLQCQCHSASRFINLSFPNNFDRWLKEIGSTRLRWRGPVDGSFMTFVALYRTRTHTSYTPAVAVLRTTTSSTCWWRE